MKRKIIGILVCGLLIANISVVLGNSEEKVNANEEERSYIFLDPLSQNEVKCISNEYVTENELPDGGICNTMDNLVPNPSFEEGDTMPTGWAYTDISSLTVTHVWDSSEAHSGAKSIGITIAQGRTGGPFEEWQTTDFIPVDFENHGYELGIWVKFLKEPTKDQYVWFGIRLYDADKKSNVSGTITWGGLLRYTADWKHARMDPIWISSDYLTKTKYIKIQLGQTCDRNPDASVIVRFDDVYFGYIESNSPPNKPDKPTGSAKGTTGIYYNYSTSATDPDNDYLGFNFSWGDGTYTEKYYNWPGELVTISHNWSVDGTYSVKVKVRDSIGARTWSDWSDHLSITMPYSYSKSIPPFLELLFQRFPNAFPLLRQLMG